MNLYKRSNGIWYLNYEHEGKRVQRSTGTRNKKEALLFISNLHHHPTPLPAKKLSEFIQDYRAYSKANKSLKTTDIDTRSLKSFLKIVGNTFLRSITTLDVEQFKMKRVEQISKTSVNIELRTCKAAFNVAVRWGYLEKNPFIGVKQLRIARKERRYLTKDDINQLLRSIREPWFYDAIVLAVNTGMRRGELVHLTWHDVNLETRVILIRNREDFVVKGGKGRTIPMNGTVYQMLSNKQRVCEYVLTGANGSQLCPIFLAKRLKRYVRELGLDPKLHFHNFRHTFATLLVQDGVPIYELKELLGHKDVQTTQIYSHMEVDSLRGSVARLDRMNLAAK